MTKITVTKDHLILIPYLCFSIDEGHPYFDYKRPYGNSNFPEQICEILEWDFDSEECEDEYKDETLNKAYKIHEGALEALHVLLTNLYIEEGCYTYDPKTEKYIKI